MRKLRYCVASSLDGFIAGPRGEYDWLVMDPTIDFAAIFRQFDTFVMGRKTWDITRGQGEGTTTPGTRTVVFSRTLTPYTKGGLRVTDQDPIETVAALKQEDGRDIWLFGGGELFRTLLDGGLVDTIEVAIMPVLVGGGVPIVAPGKLHGGLRVAKSETLPTGIVMVTYEITKDTKVTKPTKRDTKKTEGPRRHEDTKKTAGSRRHEGAKKTEGPRRHEDTKKTEGSPRHEDTKKTEGPRRHEGAKKTDTKGTKQTAAKRKTRP